MPPSWSYICASQNKQTKPHIYEGERQGPAFCVFFKKIVIVKLKA